jgi:hypothetical protein
MIPNDLDTLQAQTGYRTPATRLEAAFLNLVKACNALADDYHNQGFINPSIYGDARRALDQAEKNAAAICAHLKQGENIEDCWKNLAAGHGGDQL